MSVCQEAGDSVGHFSEIFELKNLWATKTNQIVEKCYSSNK